MSRRKTVEEQGNAYYPHYMVVLIWNDGVETTFLIKASNKDYALRATEVKALDMWEGYIVKSHVGPVDIGWSDLVPNLPVHVFTNHDHYKVPETVG